MKEIKWLMKFDPVTNDITKCSRHVKRVHYLHNIYLGVKILA